MSQFNNNYDIIDYFVCVQSYFKGTINYCLIYRKFKTYEVQSTDWVNSGRHIYWIRLFTCRWVSWESGNQRIVAMYQALKFSSLLIVFAVKTY